MDQLARWAAEANAQCDESRYALAGRDLGALLTELHVQAAGIARQLGHPHLAVQAMDRGHGAAVRLGDPALAGFAGLARAGAFSRLGARRTADTVLAQARAAVEPLARGYAQAEGDRDGEAIRHLDTADRIAPTRIRNDPIARDLVVILDRRARRQVWELLSGHADATSETSTTSRSWLISSPSTWTATLS